MAFDFPASPSEGQVFQPSGGPSYKYTSGVWTVAAPLANYAFIGDSPPASPVPGQLWWESDTGALFVYFADANSSQWVQINVPATAVVGVPRGECYLDYIGGILKLSRSNGSQLVINGTNQTIPAAGVDLAATGLTLTGGIAAGDAYYIYAFMQNATTMALEPSATAPAADVNGVMVKTGDNTRTLVGIARLSGAATWSSSRTMVASWFNPRPKTSIVGLVSPTASATSEGELSVSLRNPFCTFANREVRVWASANTSNNTASQDCYLGVGIDAAAAFQPSLRLNRHQVVGSSIYNLHQGGSTLPSEGAHYATARGFVSGGTGTWSACSVEVTIQG